MPPSPARGTLHENIERVGITVTLAVTIWIVHFSHSMQLGLYEDDWDFIGQPMTWTSTHLKDWVLFCLRQWPQGRPLGFAVVALTAFVGNRMGGLEAIYLIAFALHTVNSLLVYSIAHCRLSAAPSFCAALGFCLFPALTSTPLIEAQLFAGLTLFFLLMATWLFLRGQTVAAYVTSAGSLLTYESAFLPFFLAPLLEPGIAHTRRRGLLKHWAILLALGGFLFWLRTRMGEEKTSTVLRGGAQATLERMLIAMYAGSITTLKLFAKRLVTVVQDRNPETLIIALALAALFTIVLCLLRVRVSDKLEVWPLSVRGGWFEFHVNLSIDQETATALRLAGCGFLMMIIAHALAISRGWFPPITEDGRLTGSHLAASLGAALLCGAISSPVLDFGVSHGKRFWAALALACYFSGLAGFHHIVQEDFKKSWDIQRAFWASIRKECPDLTDATVLIYEMESYPTSTRYIQTNSWADPYVLGEVYDFPQNWKRQPQLFSVTTSWKAGITLIGDKFLWQPPIFWPQMELTPGNVILLRGTPDNLVRVSGNITIKSKEFRLKSVGEPNSRALRPGPLYKYVLQP